MKELYPPKWLNRFFRWYCREDLADAVDGDLLELYRRRVKKYGRTKANWLYFWNVLLFFQTFAFRRKSTQYSSSNTIDMLQNYFKIAIRNLLKHKSFSIINIFGLALSMSVCIIIIMLVSDQKSVDRYNSKRENIYRINTIRTDSDNLFNTFATAPLPFAEKLTSEYSGVEQAVRIRRGFGNDWIGIDQNVNIPIGGFFVDPEFINLFEFELESGLPEAALSNPNSVVLKKETAQKLYGDKDPIGEIIKVGEMGEYIVTGVLKDQQGKSHIKFDALASLSSLIQLEKDSVLRASVNNWRNHTSGYVYIELQDGSSPQKVINNMAEINREIYSDMDDHNLRFKLQHLMSITPGPILGNDIGPTLPLMIVYFLAGLAIIIMISASFNYMNLSIARALTRAKEVGIRKVAGATRKQLILQFLSESVLLSFAALVVSHVILLILKPAFDSLNLTQLLHWDLSENITVHLIIVCFTILIGIVSGLIPAFILSSFQPIKVLKDLSGIRLFSKMGIRKTLIVAQFSLSLIFIISVTLVFNQLQLMLSANFGFTTEDIINVRLNDADFEQYKTELGKSTAIQNISGATHIPGAGTWWSADTWKDPSDEAPIETGFFYVDENYIDMLDLELIAGTNFKQMIPAANEIIINEKAVNEFGFSSPHEALGQVLYDDDTTTELHIVGVLKDYHYLMLVMQISPMYLRYNPERINFAHVKLFNENKEAGFSAIERSFSEITDGNKVSYKYFDAELKEYYEFIFGDLVRIVGLTSLLALTIACLGLLGIATYSIETKIKEVSIRKILGATDKQLIYQLSIGFVLMLLVAVVVSVPLAWLLNSLWLEQIAYRVTIDFGVISFGVLILLIFGIITIGSQTYRASTVSPVDNLRNE